MSRRKCSVFPVSFGTTSYGMKISDLKKKKLPDAPGVYFFLGPPKRARKGGLGPLKEILYIGKATSLSDRVKSYFASDITSARSPAISAMVEKAKKIDYRQTDSVLEALILEANLIKENQPRYNVKEKDDKSFQYVVITKEDFPRVLLVRGKELKAQSYKLKAVFGPFPKDGMLKEALKIVRKIFPYRDKCLPAKFARAGTPASGRPCFNRQIGLCPGICAGEVSKEEYGKTIGNIRLFFEGKKKRVIKNLEKEMKTLAKSRLFEAAGKVKRKIFALKHIRDVSLIKRSEENRGEKFKIEAYDVAHLSGESAVGVMVAVSGGMSDKSHYRKFKIRRGKGANDTAGLKEILERRLAHKEWPLPDLIAVDGGKAQLYAAEKVLTAGNLKIPVVAVVKNEKHSPEKLIGSPRLAREHEQSIILANAEAHRFAIAYHRKLFRMR